MPIDSYAIIDVMILTSYSYAFQLGRLSRFLFRSSLASMSSLCFTNHS